MSKIHQIGLIALAFYACGVDLACDGAKTTGSESSHSETDLVWTDPHFSPLKDVYASMGVGLLDEKDKSDVFKKELSELISGVDVIGSEEDDDQRKKEWIERVKFALKYSDKFPVGLVQKDTFQKIQITSGCPRLMADNKDFSIKSREIYHLSHLMLRKAALIGVSRTPDSQKTSEALIKMSILLGIESEYQNVPYKVISKVIESGKISSSCSKFVNSRKKLLELVKNEGRDFLSMQRISSPLYMTAESYISSRGSPGMSDVKIKTMIKSWIEFREFVKKNPCSIAAQYEIVRILWEAKNLASEKGDKKALDSIQSLLKEMEKGMPSLTAQRWASEALKEDQNFVPTKK